MTAAKSTAIRDTRNFARAVMEVRPDGSKIFLASVMVYDAVRPDGQNWIAGFCTGWWPNRALARRIAKHWQSLFERSDCGSEKWEQDKTALLQLTEKSRRVHSRDPVGSAAGTAERADASQLGGERNV